MPDAAPATSPTVFGGLQVQHLRVTTQGSAIFAAWDPLPSSQLAGYYLYYGRVSGRYLQRRAIQGDQNSVVIRALPEGKPYYLAIRGVNAAGQETDFSPQVSVITGSPLTSTSPLAASAIAPPRPGTGGGIAGSAGLPGIWLIIIGLSAIIGMTFAFRRRLIASPKHP